MPRTVPAPATAKKSPATKTVAKTAATPTAKPAVKPVPKPAAKPVAKPAAAPTAKTAGQAATKPSTLVQVAPVKSKAKVKGAAKELKPPKEKLVRDSFTFPEAEYLVLVGLKKRLLAAGNDAKKGELVRAGIALLARLDDAGLVKALAAVDKLKTGRPAK